MVQSEYPLPKGLTSTTLLFTGFLAVLLLASCGAYPSSEEICNPDGNVVKTIHRDHEQWSLAAQNMSPGSNGVATIHVDGLTYSVRVLQETSAGQPILSISTNEGHPRTLLGINGYFYTPNDELLHLSDDYEIKQMMDNIYCYKQVT